MAVKLSALRTRRTLLTRNIILMFLVLQKLAITSPTSGGRSVGIVRLRTQTMEEKKKEKMFLVLVSVRG
jgi:hypothetical protein